jgi:signal transduction histidine kinase
MEIPCQTFLPIALFLCVSSGHGIHRLHIERLAALGLVSAGLAHERRTPPQTTPLLSYAMQKDCLHSGTLSADLEVMQNEVGRLTLLVEQFLDFARPKCAARG